MSGLTTTPEAVTEGPRLRIFRPVSTVGACVTVACFVLYALAANRAVRSPAVANAIRSEWAHGAQSAAKSGQWLVALLFYILHLIPGAGPEFLVIVGIVSTSVMFGIFAMMLWRRHRPAWEAALGALLVAVHPAMLWIATTGTPAALGAMGVILLILSFDRAEAIGDAQSLIGVGIASALMFLISSNAIYLILRTMLLLPLALRRQATSFRASLSLLLLALAPTLITLGGSLVIASMMGPGAIGAVRMWMLPLHGLGGGVQLTSPFLVSYGGSYLAALWVMTWLSMAAIPALLVMAIRLLVHRHERAQPVTALQVLLTPLSTAWMAADLQITSPTIAIAFTLAARMGWVVTIRSTKWGRVTSLLLMAAGDIITLHLPYLWDGSNGAWLHAVLGQG